MKLKAKKKDEIKGMKGAKSNTAMQVALTGITKSTESLSREKEKADAKFEEKAESMTSYVKYITIVSTALVLLFVGMRVNIETLCKEYTGNYEILTNE